MKIITLTYPISLSEIELNDQSLSIAIGHFDGVHKGHQQVISKAVSTAKANGLASAVMTFDPHPKAILGQGEQYVQCITPLSTKTSLFEQLGVDYVFIVKFDSNFSKITPDEFVTNILKTLHVVNVVVGFDFRFGVGGSGNPEIMRQLCEPSIQVDVIEAFIIDGVKVSSTVIRECLESGDIERANHLLGRNFEVEGTVVQGDQRGRTIGFPTANLRLHAPYITARLGVYAIIAHLGNKKYYGVMNHGMKPTFYEKDIAPVMEAHLFDFSKDIYGEKMTIEVVQFLRSERKFDGIAALIEQLRLDADQALKLLQQT
ncbi:bifunctional riboflavin kinase/FAD synthetase [Paenibacillus endoradicis]|uniref:bifunctional riboflavin kinase/FAD synthetase n=1 Tax=Paenibacillus endoradicis TaxID=2972487 RepID=UPI002158FA5A|nr:bifunctional riboflavin kinase/FAD synthetase [Paenibacillus endoradicis]